MSWHIAGSQRGVRVRTSSDVLGSILGRRHPADRQWVRGGSQYRTSVFATASLWIVMEEKQSGHSKCQTRRQNLEVRSRFRVGAIATEAGGCSAAQDSHMAMECVLYHGVRDITLERCHKSDEG